ncbi:MAG: cell division protein FtsQ/DivIB [Solirubrobacteraceae bacterium]|nr:cell division protein FtsQ/DivIB [Solirubrobacteraceae bacterium]
MRRMRANRFALIGAGSALTVVLLVVGFMWLRESSFVAVDDVTITGAEGSQAEEIRGALRDAAEDMTTLNVRQDALQTAAEQFPSVASVHATADFPHRLRIEVRTRTPVAALDTGQRRVAVAGDGTILTGSGTDDLPQIKISAPPSGPRVRGKEASRLVLLMAAAPPALRGRIERAFAGPSGLTVVLSDGPRLRFGRGDRLTAKWAAAARVLADEEAQGASYLDLRLPERPAAGGLAPLPTEEVEQEQTDPTANPVPGADPTAPVPTPTPTP